MIGLTMIQISKLPSEFAPARVLGCKEAADLIGCSVCTLRRMYRSGAMPAPIKVSDRLLGWQFAVLNGWLETKAGVSAEAA